MSTMITVAPKVAAKVLGNMREAIGLRQPAFVPNTGTLRAPAQLEGSRGPARPRLDREESPETVLAALEPRMLHIVRRALLPGAAPTALTPRIQALAAQLGGDAWSQRAEDREILIRQVAREICHSMMERQRN
jgi:hypothetical protein